MPLPDAERLAHDYARTLGVTQEGAAALAALRALPGETFIAGVTGPAVIEALSNDRVLPGMAMAVVDPNDPADLAAARAAQDGIRLEHGGGRHEPTAWDGASLDTVRAALNTLAGHRESVGRSFGRRGEVDPVQHLISTAAGWGGNPPQAATYVAIYPPDPSAGAIWRLRVADVPVDGFWSVTVYDARGFMAPNPRNAHSVNNVTARRGPDGVVNVQMGGCRDDTPNCLPVTEGWNTLLRLYRPRAEILDGRWQVPRLERLP